MVKTKIKYFILAGIVSLFSGGCTEYGYDEYGAINIFITDDPFPIDLIDSAGIVITKIDVRESASDTTDAAFFTLFDDTLTLNLLELRNGIKAQVGEAELAEGYYDRFRIYVDQAYLQVKNGKLYTVKVPSGSQTGIKLDIYPRIAITGGMSTELLIDFNLAKSFVIKGNVNTPAGIKGFNFKPVVRAVNNTISGIISGTVYDHESQVFKDVEVWVHQEDGQIASAITDDQGFYAIPGILAGSYDVSAYHETASDTITIEDVEVEAAKITKLDLNIEQD